MTTIITPYTMVTVTTRRSTLRFFRLGRASSVRYAKERT